MICPLQVSSRVLWGYGAFVKLKNCLIVVNFIADRNNGRGYARVLRPSSVAVIVVCKRYVLWLNGAS